jgi:hypothetical protein
MADVTEIKSVAALRKQTFSLQNQLCRLTEAVCGVAPSMKAPLDAAVHLNAKHLLLWGLKYYGSVRVLL